MCPSSGEITVSVWHLVFVTLCEWLSGLQTRQSSTQSDKYQVSHRYTYFSWWWAHSCPKHVEKRNKHTKKKTCAPSWLYLQDYTGMHGQHIYFYSMFISFLYVFQATVCPSSREITVSVWHLVFVTLYGWLSGLQTRQSSTQSDKYQVSHRYTYFSWWWAHSCPKHVEKRNKHTKKKTCAPSWLYLQDYTGMHSQQNIEHFCLVWNLRKPSLALGMKEISKPITGPLFWHCSHRSMFRRQ